MDEMDEKDMIIATLTAALMQAIEQRDIAVGILDEIGGWSDLARSMKHKYQPPVYDLLAEETLPEP